MVYHFTEEHKKNMPGMSKELKERMKAITIRVLNGETFRAIGKDHNITCERVRQIFMKCMRYTLRGIDIPSHAPTKVYRKMKNQIIPIIKVNNTYHTNR